MGTGAHENLMIRAHRLVANRTASEYLELAAKEGRAVTEDEVEKTLELWGFQRNPNRVNVFPDGRDWVWSDNLGLVRDRNGSIHLTGATHEYQSVIKILCKWLTDRLPPEAEKFSFTSLNLNCNYAAKRHRDGNNLGPSMIKAFGDFQQGELSVFPNDDKSRELEKLPEEDRVACDIKKNLCMFNGNSAHEVADFTGRRYSVVYFTASCHARAKQEDIDKLREMGVPFPSPDVDPHAILHAPAGYRSGMSSPSVRRSVPKQLRLWPVEDLSTGSAKKRRRAATPPEAKRSVKMRLAV